ncbi:MAG: hypothetical protein PUB00_03125 [Clostridiales bacterium]|nr:hypothetical protein [Clostridiales bacterium]
MDVPGWRFGAIDQTSLCHYNENGMDERPKQQSFAFRNRRLTNFQSSLVACNRSGDYDYIIPGHEMISV